MRRFTLADIKVGDFIVTGEGEYAGKFYQVFEPVQGAYKKVFVMIDELHRGFNAIDGMNADLTTSGDDHDFDIMEVYRAKYNGHLNPYRFLQWYKNQWNKLDDYECLYRRSDEPKSIEMTLKEIKEKLNISNLKIITNNK